MTKKEIKDKLKIKPRQIAKDLRKLDHFLIDNPETANMSDYIPFRIGGQPVQVRISTSRNKDDPSDRNLYFKTVNSLHPIVLQENIMQAGTLIQALCRNYYDYDSSISLYIATDIWYQFSGYAKTRIKMMFAADDDIKDFIEIIEGDFPSGNQELYVTEQNMYQRGDFSDEEMLMFFVKLQDRRCNITIRDASGSKHLLYDQSLSMQQDNKGRTVYTAIGRDGETVCFLKTDFLGIEECHHHEGLQKNTD